MKSFLRVAAASLFCGAVLTGCQQKPVILPVISKPLPQPEKVVEIPKRAPEPVKPQLALQDSADTLLAWTEFRASLLLMSLKEREQLSRSLPATPVAELQQLLIRTHPETPYAIRFKAQMQ